MKVVVRADASVTMGHGHVMRCLALADGLRKQHAGIIFVCHELPGSMCDYIAEQGFSVRRIPDATIGWQADASFTREVVEESGADWVVVDHYELDARWEASVVPSDGCVGVMAIDDLANRPHDCDVLLDQNYYPDAEQRYSRLLPAYCTRFFGPEYVLLREEFRRVSRIANLQREQRLLIFFGGNDPCGQSEVALAAALEFRSDIAIDVILGPSNPRADNIMSAYGNRPNVRLLRTSSEMGLMMAKASLCLGAGGIATFERLYMGLPSIVVATAANQREPLEALARLGCIEYLGDAAKVRSEEWLAALRRWYASPPRSTPLAVATRTERVTAALGVRLVPFSERHIAASFEFLRDAKLRDAFAMQGEPEWTRHVEYWRRKLAANAEVVCAIERFGEHVGNCGIKAIPRSPEYEGWIYLSPAVERRSGLGEVAFRRLIRIAFRRLRLERLYLHVHSDNAVALSLYRKMGFLPTTDPIDREVWGERADRMAKLVLCA